jgi:3-deoxy-D-manno-octulosonate 8-phosphate phosphatase KdsC-like HAD superfamily phosphatase
MPNTVIAIKKSATPAAQPTVLANGELAINYADGKLFYKHANGTILPFNTQGGNAFGTINANGTLVVAGTSQDVVTLVAGNNITIIGDAINDTITINATSDSNVAIGAFDKANTFNNVYTTIAGANAAVGAGANSVAVAAFDKANTISGGSGGYYSGNQGIKAPDNYGDIFRIHANTLSQNVTILSGNNAIAVGPITITGNNTTLTIQTGSRVVII